MILTSKRPVHRSVRATLSSLFSSFSKSHLLLPSQMNPTFHMYEALAKTATIDGDSSISENKSIFHGLASVLIRTTNPSHLSGERRSLGDQAFPSGRQDGVASVLEDADRGQVAWELGSKGAEAEGGRKKITSPGFSFSAAGMLIPYHLGVARLLIEKGYIKNISFAKRTTLSHPCFAVVGSSFLVLNCQGCGNETTPLAGSSAGAIVSVVIASGCSMEFALEATKKVAADCRLNGTAFRIGMAVYKVINVVLRDFLDKFLPDDIHIRSNGRIRGQYVAARPATIFRDQYCVDGALTLLMPPTHASKTVCVCAFPASRLKLKDVGISPDCSQNNKGTPQQYLRWALEPSDDAVIDKFFELGHQDASVWAQQNPVEKVVHDEEIVGSN
ncbi:hypothetical protein ACLOJK_013864 [Asimina triloba]